MASTTTINDLRVILIAEITALRDGKSNPAQTNAVLRAVQQVLATVRLEMMYSKMIGSVPRIPMIAKSSE